LAEVHPFRGIRYNQDIVGDLANVICPPYDVISPQQQQDYYRRSEYNSVRLEYGVESPEDTSENNKHTRAAVTLRQWLENNTLQADSTPAFYVHEHNFIYQGNRKQRQGLIAWVRLEQWENKVIFPHENTVSGIKSDRLELMRACAATFSPLFGIYEDPGRRVSQLLSVQTKRRPLLQFSDGSESHKVWAVTEPEVVQRTSHFLSPRDVYIADGHHRYETALAYQEERQRSNPSASDDEAFNFVMMTLVSLSDPGLLVLPIHRLVRGIPFQVLAELKSQLALYFDMESVSLSEAVFSDYKGTSIRVLGLEPGNVTELKFRHAISIDEAVPGHYSEAYKRLDVSLVQNLIIEKLIGPLDEVDGITYTHDAKHAQRQVENGEYQLAFLVNPIPVLAIKAISDAGERMPGKSTYFHPKLPTGLVSTRLEGRI